MNVSALRIAGLVTLVAAIGTAAGILASTDNSELSQIAGYRQWTRLSESPRIVFDTSFAGG
jgi:hypothetical protein